MGSNQGIYIAIGLPHNLFSLSCLSCVYQCSWQDSGEIIAVGISANVVSYTISTVLNGAVASEVNVTIDASNHTNCTSTTCKYCIKNFTVMSESAYSIYITANDLLSDGYRERKMCTNRPISKKSNVKHKVKCIQIMLCRF